MPKINPMIEEPTRELFGHALRAEFEAFEQKLSGFPDDESLREAVVLAAQIAAYVVVDQCGGERPSEFDLRKIAASASEIERRYEIDENKAFAYLSRGVFGGEPLDEVLSPQDAGAFPFIVGGNLLGSTAKVEDGQSWTDYLDVIEAELEKA